MSHHTESELIGHRVRLIQMFEDPYPIEPGSEGVVMNIGADVIMVKWDNGRTLGMINGMDKFELVEVE